MLPKTNRGSMRNKKRSGESKSQVKNVQFKIETDFDESEISSVAFQA